MKVLLIFAILWASSLCIFSQAPDVPIARQGRGESQQEAQIEMAAKDLFSSSNVIKLGAIEKELRHSSCRLDLPKMKIDKLSSRELCIAARRSHVRLGWAYLCKKCEDWHLNLAGGYFLDTNGAVATCYHVIKPSSEIREGCLIGVDEARHVMPVTQILAANRYSDACIVKVSGGDFHPLPLNTNLYPGDPVYCYSDPLDHRGYFSDGIVNRFYQFPGRRPFGAAESTAFAPMRINVSTDWAPGSSGSAVLDQSGNAIGHVSTISLMGEDENADSSEPKTENPLTLMMITFHEAVSARDVLLLIQPGK